MVTTPEEPASSARSPYYANSPDTSRSSQGIQFACQGRPVVHNGESAKEVMQNATKSQQQHSEPPEMSEQQIKPPAS